MAADAGSLDQLRAGRLVANTEPTNHGKLGGPVEFHSNGVYVDVPADGAAAYMASVITASNDLVEFDA